MARKHFALRYRLDGKEGYLVGFEDEFDGVALGDDGHLLAYPDAAKLYRAVEEKGWQVDRDEPELYDLDALNRWLAAPSAATVDCSGFLDAWNLVLDLRSTLAGKNVLGAPDENLDLYDKLFYGNNLPAVTPPGEHYTPNWNATEVQRLAAVLKKGLEELRAHLPKR